MRFLVDAQLPPGLARCFGERGLSATPARDVGMRESDDGGVFYFAVSGGWTVITKDEDLIAHCIGNPAAPAIVWLRSGNCANGVLRAWLEPLIAEIQRRLNEGEKLIELRDTAG